MTPYRLPIVRELCQPEREAREDERVRDARDERRALAMGLVFATLLAGVLFAFAALLSGCAWLKKEEPVIAPVVQVATPVILEVAQIACLAAVADLGVSDPSMAFSICEIAKEAESAALTEFVALVKGHAMAESARAKMTQPPRSVAQ